ADEIVGQTMNEEEYFLLLEGETTGPFTLEQLQHLWFNKGIPLDTLYARPGLKECRPIDTLLHRIIAYQKAGLQEVAAPPPKRMSTAKWVTVYSLILVLLVIFLWSISPFVSRYVKAANVVKAT